MPEFGLRARFTAAHLVVVLLLGGAFTLSVMYMIEKMEEELLETRIRASLDHFVEAWQRDPSTPPPDIVGTRGMVVPAGAVETLPTALQRLPPGIHDDIKIEDREYFVGRHDVGDTRLYLLFDIEPVEVLETRIMLFATLCILLGSSVAILVARRLSGRVLRPVSELADYMSSMTPGAPRQPFSRRYGDPHIDSMADAFERYLQRIDDFIAREQALTEDISHELRTPLTVARGAVTLLLESKELAPQARQRIERIDRAARQMQELTEAILFLAREDGGGGIVAVDLRQIIGDVIESRRETAERSGVTIEVRQLAAQTVMAHAGMAMSVVGNLLDNAIRHGGAGTVVVTLADSSLTIEDHGPGLPEAQRLTPGARRGRGADSIGHGLGLHIVGSLCERLSWTLHIDSATTGTRVVIRFPTTAQTKR